MKNKNEKAITLIALVITIIVLLILAGVAINMAIDSDGLFGKANEAVEGWNTAVEEERTAVQELLNSLEEQTRETTLVDLFEEGKLNIGDYVSYNPIKTGDAGTEEKYSYTVLNDNVGYTLDKSDPTATIPEFPEEQTYTVNTETKWRVLGVEGEGAEKHILLISADPIRNTGETTNYLTLAGAKGYVNGPTELNNISAIYGYGDGAAKARSVKAEDINKITGVAVSNEGLTPDVGWMENSEYSYNGYTPESWKGDQIPATISGICNAYEYSANEEGLQTNTTTNPKTGARLYEAIFDSTSTKYFWLASDGRNYIGSGMVFYGLGFVGGGEVSFRSFLCFNNGDYMAYSNAVRPVVELLPGVTEVTVKIIEDQPREDWNE